MDYHTKLEEKKEKLNKKYRDKLEQLERDNKILNENLDATCNIAYENKEKVDKLKQQLQNYKEYAEQQLESLLLGITNKMQNYANELLNENSSMEDRIKDININQKDVEEYNAEAEKKIDTMINKLIKDEQVGAAGKEIIKEELQEMSDDHIRLLKNNMRLKKLVASKDLDDFIKELKSIVDENTTLERKWMNILPQYDEKTLDADITTMAKKEIETFQNSNGITINSEDIKLLKKASIQAKQKNIFFKNALYEKFKAKFDSANSKLEKDNNKMTEEAKELTNSNNVKEMIDKALNEIQKDTDEGVNWDIIDDKQLTSLSEEEAALLSCEEEFNKFNTQYFRNIALQKIIKDNTQNAK